MPDEDLQRVWLMRKAVSDLNSAEAMAEIVGQLDKYDIPYKLSEKNGQWLLIFYAADNLSTDASVWLESMSLRITPAGWVFVLLNERKAQ